MCGRKRCPQVRDCSQRRQQAFALPSGLPGGALGSARRFVEEGQFGAAEVAWPRLRPMVPGSPHARLTVWPGRPIVRWRRRPACERASLAIAVGGQVFYSDARAESKVPAGVLLTSGWARSPWPRHVGGRSADRLVIVQLRFEAIGIRALTLCSRKSWPRPPASASIQRPGCRDGPETR